MKTDGGPLAHFCPHPHPPNTQGACVLGQLQADPKCPVCRQEIASATPSYSLRRVVDTYRDRHPDPSAPGRQEQEREQHSIDEQLRNSFGTRSQFSRTATSFVQNAGQSPGLGLGAFMALFMFGPLLLDVVTVFSLEDMIIIAVLVTVMLIFFKPA
eukprot:m.117681 g.117681  ORF g.117681 m.117681 type:complete len:156 (-) comp16407_c0_seq1:54-521(-)